jgi:hypothetical protein
MGEAMSISAMNKVYESGLEKSMKAIALAYADHAHDDGSHIFPAINYISWKTGYSRRSVQSITRQLEEIGVLVNVGKGPSGVNRYRMIFKNLPARKPYRGAKSAPPEEVEDDYWGADFAPQQVQNLHGQGAPAAPKPSSNHQSNHQDHMYEASNPERLRDKNLEKTIMLLDEACGGDVETAKAVWQLQQAFCESSGIPRPDIDTEYGRKELQRDWWPVILAMYKAADGDLEAAKAGVTAAVGDMLAWRATAVSGPWSIKKKFNGVLNAQRQAQNTPQAAPQNSYQQLNQIPVSALLG